VDEPFDLAIRGGLVVSPAGRRPLDVYVRDGRVAALVPGHRAEAASSTVDAGGLLVLPGFVDTHVHLMDPGDAAREDFPTGTRAAARSGVTTIVEHTHGWPVTSLERLHEKLAHLRGRAHVDFGLAAHAWTDNLHRVAELWAAGIAFFKVFTCETHGVPAMTADLMLDLFEQVAANDATCLVHCEDDLITARNERRLRAAGRLDGGLLTEWRSREAELVAVGTAGMLARATGAEITIAHVSTTAVLEVIAREASAGGRIVAESCPQYLTLRESEVLTHGALRKFTPPARIRSDADEQAMWTAFDRGEIGVLSTDHAPSTLEQKAAGNLWDVHFGLPGLDTTSSVLIDAALRERTSLERVVEAYSAAPARRYRLPGKGAIAPGWDADLVLVDPSATRVVHGSDVLSRAGWTPYEGREVRGAVVATLSRGRWLVRDGAVVDQEPAGRFVEGPGARHARAGDDVAA
jgi:dihydroorotase (multifunctional complex type)